MRSRSVAVVGAGPSGLVATKELLQEGHTVTCFEKTDSIGGVFTFRADPLSAGVWKSCRLTSSMLVTSFSDFFPDWQESVPYTHTQLMHYEYLRYLEQYASHFNLLPHIRLGCEVVDLAPATGDGWRISVQYSDREEQEVHHFNAVAVCSGIHTVPRVPEIPGLQRFAGQILHAANYKSPASLRGTSAVFVGAGESGGDIIAEASAHLERSYLSLRRGVFVIPRLLNGLPNDYTGTRLLYSLPEFVTRRSDPEAQELRRRAALALFPVRVPLLWARWVSTLVKDKAQAVDERLAKVERLIEQLRAESGGNQFETFATKTESFVEAIVDGRCELRPGIETITPTGVVFTDGSRVEVDTILLCTGFEKASVPFLNVSVNLERLYKNCFDPAHREKLAFIGFVRPTIGSIPPMSELQARWHAQLLSDNLRLPSGEEMHRQVESESTRRAIYHGRVFGRLPHLVDYSTYMEDLAELIGCKPRLADFIKRPRLLYKLYTSAFCGAQYRFRGPHPRPELAAKVIAHAHSHARAVRFLDLALAEAARLVGLRRLQPHLTLAGRLRHRARNIVA